MRKKLDIKILVIVFLGVTLFLVLGSFLFVWKITNILDVMLAVRVRPMTCMMEEYRYQLPYSKVEDESISEQDWNTYKDVGAKFFNGGEPCEQYEDVVWFDVIGDKLVELFEDEIKE